MTTPELHVSGNAFVGGAKYFRKRFGDARFGELVARLQDRQFAEEFASGVFRTKWYPFANLVDLCESLEAMVGTGDGAFVHEYAQAVAEEDLGSIFRVLLAVFGTPAAIGQRAPQLWTKYYDQGAMELVESVPGRLRIQVKDFPAPHRLHCASLAGWMERCIELTRVKNSRVEHPRCRCQGAPVCEFVVTWSP